MQNFTLANGIEVPSIGFGTYKAAEGDNSAVLMAAIQVGYRYFDTASFYHTEEALGLALRKSGLSRDKFQIASKLWKDEMGYEGAMTAFKRTTERLGIDDVDVYLIHWPRSDEDSDWKRVVQETWRAMEELYQQGCAHAIGVSNFLPHHLEVLAETAKIFPMINQIEFHPGYTQQETMEYCLQYGVLPQAWSPLGRTRVLEHEMIAEVAKAHSVSAAQVCLRYALEKGVMPLPKASAAARMEQNMDVFGFSLTDEEVKTIDHMPQTGWSGQHPDVF